MTSPEPCPAERFSVGIVVSRRKLAGPWAEHAWLPVKVLAEAPAAAPGTLLTAATEEMLLYAGSYEVMLHRGETGHYRDNLGSGQPSLWVALRPSGEHACEIATVTADPYEGEALAEGIGEIVEAVPMPVECQAKVAAFVDAFHVERAFVKRKRDRADSEALARSRPPLSRRDVE